MVNFYNKGNRDKNEAEILELLNSRNVRATQLRPGDGADLLIWIHPMEVWEVKNPEQPPSKRALTNCERETLAYCTATHIPFIVVETVDDAAERLNNYFSRL